MLSLFVSLWLVAGDVSTPPGWFYQSRVKLEYPGAYSYMLDGPFRSREHCEMSRESAMQTAQMFGVQFETQSCHERKES